MPMPMLPWLLLVIFCLGPSHAAYVQTAQCGSGKVSPFTATSADGHLFGQVTVDVLLRDDVLLYRVQLTALEDIADANATTNRLTTLSINTNFISGEVYQTSVRLCDYLTVVQDSVFSGPPGGRVEARNSTFTGDDSLSAIADLFALAEESNALPPNTTDVSWIAEYEAEDSDASDVSNFKVGSSVCPVEEGTRYQLIYINKVDTDRYFGSYDTQFTFVSASGEDTKSPQNMQCFEVLVTPHHPNYITLPICFGILAIFVVGVVSTFYIYHYSPNQESSNVFLLIASSICNEPLLNELTPDVMSLLHYLQFSLFSVCLNLAYPWFLPVIMSYLNWVALIRIDVFSSSFINPMSVDGVYQTLGRFALFGIFPIKGRNPDSTAIMEIWGNFMIWISCTVVFFVILSHFSVYISCKRESGKSYPWTKSLLNSSSVCIQFFYQFFPLPFISISSFLLLAWFTKLEGLSHVASSFSLIFMIIWCAVFIRFYYRNVWKDSSKLYSSLKTITVWGSTYHYYKPELVSFIMVDKLKIFVDGIIIGMGSRYGSVQLLLLIFFSIFYTFALVYYQPFFNRRRNIWVISLTLIQIVNLVLSVAFIRDLGISNTSRSIIGDVQLIIHSLVMWVFMFFFILRTVQVFLKRRRYTQGWITEEDSEQNKTGNVDDRSVKIIGPEDEHQGDSTVVESLNKKRTGSFGSHESTHRLELTDPRALPGLSLKYIKGDEEVGDELHRPTAVSPITYEYLERIHNEDSEVRVLWQNRLKRRANGKREHDETTDEVITTASWFDKLRKNPVDSSEEKGFSVVGRRPIVNVDEKRKSVITEDKSDYTEKEVNEKKKKGEKKGFVVVGRKPIALKRNSKD